MDVRVLPGSTSLVLALHDAAYVGQVGLADTWQHPVWCTDWAPRRGKHTQGCSSAVQSPYSDR